MKKEHNSFIFFIDTYVYYLKIMVVICSYPVICVDSNKEAINNSLVPELFVSVLFPEAKALILLPHDKPGSIFSSRQLRKLRKAGRTLPSLIIPSFGGTYRSGLPDTRLTPSFSHTRCTPHMDLLSSLVFL